MRKIYRTEAFDKFFESLPDNVKEKVRYLLFMITEMKVVNTKDYKKEIQKAQHILDTYYEKED